MAASVVSSPEELEAKRTEMMRHLHLAAIALVLSNRLLADEPATPQVLNLQVVHRHGQTFVTWKDVAAGEEGAMYRYSVYRSERPITADNLPQAELCFRGVLNNSARLFGTAFNYKTRLDATKPTMILEEGGTPLPMWSGLAVHTVTKAGPAFYAVVATDVKLEPLSRVVPGKSATTEPVDTQVAPIEPIKLHDSKKRGIYTPQTLVTGTKGLPLRVQLHASEGQGGGAGDYGDDWLYFANASMGYRDGLPGVFSVQERREKTGNYLMLNGRDTIEHPDGKQAMETFWFGYLGIPQHATHTEPRAYPFTERREDWIIDWVVKRYGVDPERVTISGGSMGAWGSTTYGLRRPELFAAIYPNRPRTRQKGLPRLAPMPAKGTPILMDDGKTDYFERMDLVKFTAEHPADLPFAGWCCGRHDGFASWQEQIDLVRAMTAGRHGFAFAWNDGDHSSGAEPMAKIQKWYPPEKFARNRSYPAFSNSSIDDKLGSGDPKDGDLVGGINLGFVWKDVADEEGRWGVTLSNELAKADMTVDVTPRRCQKFRPRSGEELRWTTSTGASGMVTADKNGLVTLPGVTIPAGTATTITIRAR
jgi:hypothetical protein